MQTGVPLDTDVKIGIYSEKENGSSIEELDVNGVVADAAVGLVFIACGDRKSPYSFYELDGKQPKEKWDTFILKVDRSRPINTEKAKQIGVGPKLSA